MTPSAASSQTETFEPLEEATSSFAETGWHEELVEQPDGTFEIVWTPLTEAEFLHPREGDHLPVNTFHSRIVDTLMELLQQRFSDQPTTKIFHDLLIKWDIDLGDHSPDVCVVFDVKNPEIDRSEFRVATEGVRPALIIEVVSPRYRSTDRKTKVLHYARAQVQEYFIVDRRRSRGQTLEEVIGYRLVSPGVYQPITPDEEGRVRSRVAGVWISLRNGNVILEDAQTGARLLTADELAQKAQEADQRAIAADQRAEEERQRAEEERQRATAADQRAEEERQRAEKLAEFLRSQGFDPDRL